MLVGGLVLGALSLAMPATAQFTRTGNPVPPELRAGYEKALDYLSKSQSEDGGYTDNTGITGICVMALIASGEDPNYGPYAENVRRGLRYIINKQDPRTGFIATGMYEHGFAMLALADAYGAVDDHLLWGEKQGRTLAQSLELAVRCCVTSQEQNPFGAWRYSPSGKDADTSVSGAVLMGLLGARNAGIEVPDKSIDAALEYFSSMTIESGNVAYSGFSSLGSSDNRSAICALVFAVAKRKDMDAFNYASKYVRDNSESGSPGHGGNGYFRYYTAQALFQADHELWKRWNAENTKFILSFQGDDGSISMPGDSHGVQYSTGMALLSSALTYCFLPVYER